MKAHTVVALVIALMISMGAHAGLVSDEVAYRAGDTTLKGYLVYDPAVQGERPGVLVVHEWWGHNDYARQRAEQLARLGYTALAVDMYGDGAQAHHPEEAGQFAGAVRQNLPLMSERFMAAYDVLGRHATVDAGRIGAIGYCFGGAVVLEMARQGKALAAVASFHGSLAGITQAEPGTVKARILVANGAADPMVSDAQKQAFRAEMDAAGARYTFIDYPGALHSFTNPDADRFGEQFGLPLRYDAAADAASWEAMQTLFEEAFTVQR